MTSRPQPPVEFWSSTEVAAFQRALVQELGAKGRGAVERCAVPLAAYWSARSWGARLALRLRAYGWYPLRLAGRLLGSPAELVAIVTSNTFYAPRVALLAASRGTAVVHWVFDLYPDVLIAAGIISSGGFLDRLLGWIVRSTFVRADANVFLGAHLLRHAERRYGPIPRARVIAVGAEGGPFRETPPQPRAAGPLRVLYCGNLGRMHDVDTLLGALPEGLPPGLTMEFRGNGVGFVILETALRDTPAAAQIKFGPNLPEAEWVAAMKAADVALVTMRPDAAGLVMPSKTYSALVAGQAVLAVCPADSDLAELIRQHDCGWVVSPGDCAGLAGLLRRLAGSPAEVLACRRRAWQAGHEHYDQRVLAGEWSKLLDTVSSVR